MSIEIFCPFSNKVLHFLIVLSSLYWLIVPPADEAVRTDGVGGAEGWLSGEAESASEGGAAADARDRPWPTWGAAARGLPTCLCVSPGRGQL